VGARPAIAADALPGAAEQTSWPPPTDGGRSLAAPSSEPPDWLRDELSAGGLTRLTAASLLIVGAGGLLVLLVRWTHAGRGRPPEASHHAPQVLGTLRLGPQVGLHLVQFQHHKALVGVDRGGLKSICLLPDGFGEMVDSQIASEPVAAETAPAETSRWRSWDRLT
jgi:hypothetical protein